ncbi:glycosyltransferase family 4 protein [Planococcus donghaensis]|uniref:Glycosyl transferase family 1 domain-containing protein n=1 Tax=Planococcus donghaensis TaxID=414778 RepID=A0A1C7EFN7_9BACL|nr:glycosyltransferase family 4 protein [Planococcus donghaensis]ANU22491.1 hypothetical protein BCM40_03590 [Planococcus donghaensis]
MKKKILFLESRSDSFYGAQKSMLKLIQSLNQNEFECVVVTTKEGELSKELRKKNIPIDIVKLNKKANIFGGEILQYSILKKMNIAVHLLIYNFKIFLYLRKNKIDTIYVNDIRALIYSILATKIMRKKNIWYIRADISDTILSKLALRFSDNIITIANGVLRHVPKDKLLKYNGKITNIYTGFDFSEYQISDKENSKKNIGLSKNKLVIGYLGSINERKGTDFLIDSFIRIKKIYNDTELLVVGNVSPGYENYWKNLMEKVLKYGESIKYIPYSNKVSDIYSAMDIFILPSRSEGLPRVVIEAMAHKIPVISTDVGGVREIIENNINGFVIEKDNSEELFSELNSLLKDSLKRKKIGELGEKSARNNFSEEVFIKKINSYFREIHRH